MGRGRPRRGTTQARFAEEEGSDSDATRIVEQILAKLWPDLQQNREPSRRPPTPGPQKVCSAERETAQTPTKDHSKGKNSDKHNESKDGRYLHGQEPIKKQRGTTPML